MHMAYIMHIYAINTFDIALYVYTVCWICPNSILDPTLLIVIIPAIAILLMKQHLSKASKLILENECYCSQ